MIICHCNVIRSDEIEAAVEEALARMPVHEVTAEHVFSICGREPACGTCRETISVIIEDMVTEREATEDRS